MFLLLADFFSSKLMFSKIKSGVSSECQTVLILIRADVLSVRIWVQTVCKGYQWTTLAGRVKMGLS